jgi:hypothetical protein
MFVVGYQTPSTFEKSNGHTIETLGKRKYELLDSLKEFRKFLEENQSFHFREVWHLLCNFGTDDVTKEVFDSIYAAKIDVKTIVENTEFEEICGEKMEFTIISASSFA